MSETFLVLRRIQRDMIINVHTRVGLHVKYRYACQILMKLEFSQQIIKTQISNFVKICTVGVEPFHADEQAKHDEANSRFSQFCEHA